MRLRVLYALMLCGVMGGLVVVDAPVSHARPGLTLDRPRITPDSVVLRGSAPKGAKVRILRQTEDGRKQVAKTHADARGRYRVRLERPKAEAWVVRAFSGHHRSAPRRLMPAPAPAPEPVDPEPGEPAPVDACGEQLTKANGTPWECTFSDDFDGTSLDPTKWFAQETFLSGVTNGTDGCIRKEPWTIAVSEGQLQLTAVRTTPAFTCKSPLGAFVTDKATAAITTKGRFNQAYGRFGFRAKMPSTRVAGAHSALWLYPDQHTYGRWPLSGEIDVAEWYSARPGRAYSSVHYANGSDDLYSSSHGLIEDVSQFHNYVLEWTPTEMKFYFDRTLVFVHRYTPLPPLTGSQPFDRPFNVVLNQTWGHLWNTPTAETPKRVTMTVDWVRVWK